MIGIPTALQSAQQADEAVGLLRRFLWHSRLGIIFDYARTYRTFGEAPQQKTFVHLVCVNKSWWVHAVSCRATLRKVWRRDPNTHVYAEHPGFVGPVPMRWANTPTTGPLALAPLELDPGERRLLDLGVYLSGGWDFHLCLPAAYTGVIRVLEPGAYRIEVEVRASNSLPLRCRRRFDIAVRNGARPTVIRAA